MPQVMPLIIPSTTYKVVFIEASSKLVKYLLDFPRNSTFHEAMFIWSHKVVFSAVTSNFPLMFGQTLSRNHDKLNRSQSVYPQTLSLNHLGTYNEVIWMRYIALSSCHWSLLKTLSLGWIQNGLERHATKKMPNFNIHENFIGNLFYQKGHVFNESYRNCMSSPHTVDT